MVELSKEEIELAIRALNLFGRVIHEREASNRLILKLKSEASKLD